MRERPDIEGSGVGPLGLVPERVVSRTGPDPKTGIMSPVGHGAPRSVIYNMARHQAEQGESETDASESVSFHGVGPKTVRDVGVIQRVVSRKGPNPFTLDMSPLRSGAPSSTLYNIAEAELKLAQHQPLMAALQARDFRKAQALLSEVTIELDGVDEFGNNCLHLLLSSSKGISDTGTQDMMGRLIARGCPIDTANDKGVTPLGIASSHGDAQAMAVMLRSKSPTETTQFLTTQQSTGTTMLQDLFRTMQSNLNLCCGGFWTTKSKKERKHQEAADAFVSLVDSICGTRDVNTPIIQGDDAAARDTLRQQIVSALDGYADLRDQILARCSAVNPVHVV